MISPKASHMILIIMIIGLILRIWGVGFGLPYQFHQDEPIIVNHALAYGTGDFNPHFFIIPPLTSYILFFFYAVYFLILKASGVIAGTDAFAISFFKDPALFYLIGRSVAGVLPSILSIYLTYRLSLKFLSKKAAIYSSFVMAVVFLNVINAHYIYTDNFLVMFILLAYIAMSGLIIGPKKINYILSGVFIGMAIAIKYNAALLVAPFLYVHFVFGDKRFFKKIFDLKIFFFVSALFLSFIICNPYSVLDWKFFLVSLAGRIRHEYVGLTHHLIYSLFEGLGMAASIIGIAGLITYFKEDFKKAVFLILFPFLFYLHLVIISQFFSRYVLALVPFLSIGLGFILYDCLYIWFKEQYMKVLVVMISCVLILPTLAKSLKADSLFTSKDTRIEAAEWIKDNVPHLSRIALDHTFFCPPLKQTVNQLKEKESIINRQPELKELKSKKLDLQIVALQGEKTYEIYYIVQGNENTGQFLAFWPVIKNDPAALEQKGIEYVVIDNMKTSRSMRLFQEQIAEKYNPIMEFNPYKKSGFRKSYDEIDTTCMPIIGKELFSRQRLGPYMVIYKTK